MAGTKPITVVEPDNSYVPDVGDVLLTGVRQLAESKEPHGIS